MINKKLAKSMMFQILINDELNQVAIPITGGNDDEVYNSTRKMQKLLLKLRQI